MIKGAWSQPSYKKTPGTYLMPMVELEVDYKCEDGRISLIHQYTGTIEFNGTQWLFDELVSRKYILP